MIADLSGDALRILCLEALQARVDAYPPGYAHVGLDGAYWVIGYILMPAMWGVGGFIPGFDPGAARLLGLRVEWAERGVGISLVTRALP